MTAGELAVSVYLLPAAGYIYGEVCKVNSLVCVVCGRGFRASRVDARTCSQACRQRLYRAPVVRQNAIEELGRLCHYVRYVSEAHPGDDGIDAAVAVLAKCVVDVLQERAAAPSQMTLPEN